MPVVVRFTKADRAEENQALIEKVFEELAQRQPEGFTYKVFRLEDGVSFIHVVIEHEDVADPDSLQRRPGFPGVHRRYRRSLRSPAGREGRLGRRWLPLNRSRATADWSLSS